MLGSGDLTTPTASSTLLSDTNVFSGTNTFTTTITGSISGNAGTATALQNARTINGTSFDGTQNITISAASSTLLANANTWSAAQTFASAPILSTLSGLLKGNGASAVTAAQAGVDYQLPMATAGSAVFSSSFPLYGDGLTDDADVLQTMFDSVSSNGGTVYISPGQYLVSHASYLKSHTHVYCYPGATFIMTDGGNYHPNHWIFVN